MNQNTKKQPHVCDGHVWIPTSTPRIERCGRAGCRVMRQWSNGAWSAPATGAQKTSATPTTDQPGLWA